MGIYKGKASFTFMYSACPNGANCAEDADTEHEVEVTFTQEQWTEHHPFGSTTAAETLCEVDDQSFEYKLDGEEVSLDDLQERFGREWIDSKLEAAQNDADLTELKDDSYDPD